MSLKSPRLSCNSQIVRHQENEGITDFYFHFVIRVCVLLLPLELVVINNNNNIISHLVTTPAVDASYAKHITINIANTVICIFFSKLGRRAACHFIEIDKEIQRAENGGPVQVQKPTHTPRTKNSLQTKKRNLTKDHQSLNHFACYFT